MGRGFAWVHWLPSSPVSEAGATLTAAAWLSLRPYGMLQAAVRSIWKAGLLSPKIPDCQPRWVNDDAEKLVAHSPRLRFQPAQPDDEIETGGVSFRQAAGPLHESPRSRRQDSVCVRRPRSSKDPQKTYFSIKQTPASPWIPNPTNRYHADDGARRINAR